MENSTMITDRAGIDNFRILALLKGLKRGRGKSCYQILKDEFGLKGSKQKVYDQLNQVFEDWKKENGAA